MVILYIYSICWRLKSVFYEHQTHLLSLNFYSPWRKARPEAMQEIRDNKSVDPWSDIPDELMQPYLAVPTYHMELL
jgi:hypothetical protein